MLEILCIIWLSNKNKANALQRGRKPGVFVGLTFGLLFGLELLGIIVGLALKLGYLSYAIALVLALIGGLISYLVAKNCTPGNYVDPSAAMARSFAADNEALEAPSQINVVRDSSPVGALAAWSFALNGRELGQLSNGQYLSAVTAQKKNILTAKDSVGTEIPPFAFEAAPGTAVEIHFKAGKFIPEASRGIVSVITANASVNAESPTVSVPYEGQDRPAPQQFCTNCGAKQENGSAFCACCGAKLIEVPYAHAQFAPAYTQVPPAAASEKNNLRAVWASLFIFAGWLLTIALHSIGPRPIALAYSSTALSLSAFAILGTAVYLATEKELKWKLTGCGLTLFSLLLSYVGTIASSTRNELGLIRIRVVFRAFGLYHINDLISFAVEHAIAIGLALLFAWIFREKDEKSRTALSALIAAAGAFLFDLIYYIRAFRTIANSVALFTDILLTAVIIFVCAYASRSLCSTPSAKIELRGWGKVWCWICTVGMGLSAIGIIVLAIAQRDIPSRGAVLMFSTQLILSIAALVGFILLLSRKRVGWYFILFASVIVLCGQFCTSLINTVHHITQYYSLLAGSILGAATPIITRVSIDSAWKETRPRA